MAVDLDAPGMLKSIAKHIGEQIDSYCVKTYDDGMRKHLGASVIGDKCSRKLWYSFRWCFYEQNDGRKQRLFNRGHREEERFIEWLRGIGCQVHEVGEDGKQFRMSAIGGHFGGSCDGVAILPEYFGIPERVLLEFKTNGTGRGFNDLTTKGVKLAKPVHWAQMCTYGYAMNLNYALYMCINKNDDSMHIELVKLDHELGAQMQMKAERIITSQQPPPRISDNPTFFDCKFCAGWEICHNEAPTLRNCRSCKHAAPIEEKAWRCGFHNGVIPTEFIATGCDSWESINVS